MLTNFVALSAGPVDDLAVRWSRYRAQNPKSRVRDAAAALGVSEAELVATGTGATATRLQPRWPDLLNGVMAVGRVMALTRNDSVVHERHGRYEQIEINGPIGLVLGPDIDLRLFLNHWRHVFAVNEGEVDRRRLSIQVFDRSGQAIHKIYATDGTDRAAFERLIESLASDDQAAGLIVDPPEVVAGPRADSDIALASLRDGWLALQDTHDFHGLLRRHDVARLQAFRLIGADLARPLARDAGRRALEAAAATALPIMIFVGNPGAIQIHTGPVRKLISVGPWLNVLDPDFNLHLNDGHITSAWAVRKPTREGDIHSVELFDAAGTLLATLFGKRKPGQPEDGRWRALVDALPSRAGV